MSSHRYAAVDLGASTGRVLLGWIDGGRISAREVTRFTNEPVRLPDGLHWDLLGLHRATLDGITAAARDAEGELVSVGIDTWGVDYGLLDDDGALLGIPHHYRDERTTAVVDTLDRDVVYQTTGIQFLPINTLCQLIAARETAAVERAATMLLMPDLLGYLLTGETGCERTNASTTQLLDVRTGNWSTDLADRYGIPARILPAIRDAGDPIGHLRADVVSERRLEPQLLIRAVASHDTASAVVAVPASGPNFAYISCGTWSLVGIETASPVLSAASRDANFTNELGIDGTIRYLRNVMGLWLLQESVRTWRHAGLQPDLSDLLRQAADRPALRSIIDPDDPNLLLPGDIPEHIRTQCRLTGQPVPADAPAMVRCILDSLALAHGETLSLAERLSGRHVEVVHLLGGGARNELLCQLTANACRRPVIAGPVEATALGNLLVQARADGSPMTLQEMRGLVRHSVDLRRFDPAEERAWLTAAEHFAALKAAPRPPVERTGR